MSSKDTTSRVTRRGAIATLGAGAAASLAGCSASLGGGSSSSSSKKSQNQPTTNSGNGAAGNSEYLIDHNTVVWANSPTANEAPCQEQNLFLHGQSVVFRVKIIDPNTGKQVTGKDISGAAVNIKTGSGKTIPLTFEAHPNKKHTTDHFWVGVWKVPSGFPSGTVNYSINIKNHSSETVNFNVAPSKLTIKKGTYKPNSSSSSTNSSS